MEYRNLGRSGLIVSIIGFGVVTMQDEEKFDQYLPIIQKCLEKGVNFFDASESYGVNGSAEKILGRIFKKLKTPREQIIVSTKLGLSQKGLQTFYQKNDTLFPNEIGLSRKHIIEGCNNSLKRLQLEYVDIISPHVFDYKTPIEEVCRAFNFLINQGFFTYYLKIK